MRNNSYFLDVLALPYIYRAVNALDFGDFEAEIIVKFGVVSRKLEFVVVVDRTTLFLCERVELSKGNKPTKEEEI